MIKRQIIASVREDVERLKALQNCCWECKMVQLLWKTVWQFLKMLILIFTIWTNNSILGLYPRGLKTYVHPKTCTQMSRAAFFIIAPKWKQPKCLIDKWINKLWYSHTMEYLFRSEKEWSTDKCYNVDESWKHDAKFKKTIMKDHILYNSISVMSSTGKSTETDSRLATVRTRGRQMGRTSTADPCTSLPRACSGHWDLPRPHAEQIGCAEGLPLPHQPHSSAPQGNSSDTHFPHCLRPPSLPKPLCRLRKLAC